MRTDSPRTLAEVPPTKDGYKLELYDDFAGPANTPPNPSFWKAEHALLLKDGEDGKSYQGFTIYESGPQNLRRSGAGTV
ncbi:hypothetical protein N0V88_005561 [Collariella sp. IMI 366227]|nr:hypothetical protein N0V88_005561 [Collariella sp. IMI 366227]